ncbi:MAG: potassium-transporting ATPase subunit KdpA [Bdellovibrionales bacterium RIFCSPHIGHO2_01_FULL_40_29]|nr:MAG: potassium-transporting ATPase subunit KdpA [Bdellovibrionales bacterium RIFCSPHIGHO2_01_FULL_40_29]OFZ34246.1 MAG: potassium-transporting ATPase subunit KdpA [Bdellovibrionales bacterium RIFCSPHIGHO2_02_FULL_40_15]
MEANDVIQLIVYIAVFLLLTPILGAFIASVLMGKKTFLTPILGWLEKAIYKFSGVNPSDEMNWKSYAKSLLVFNFLGFLFVFLLQLTQKYLPLNPQSLSNISWDQSFNTAVSFMTNTNWQSYGGEGALSYLTQMLGLTVQNFVSAATGIAVFAALVRGIKVKQTSKIGNFWVDLTRSTVYILLPLSLVFSVVLVGQGVIQNFSSYQVVTTLEGATQSIPGGLAASQVAIKQLGTNGGGFFNTNSAHPFENPTPFSNFLQMLAILLIPGALVFAYGKMVGSFRQGITIFLVMFSVWIAGLGVSIVSEYSHNSVLGYSGIMEGKETRLGVINSLIWSTATTVASNGSVNSMHSSLSPLSGGVALFNMLMGEVIFGGVGAGMYGMLLFVLLTVFLSGLMVGRSPEYLGKKIEFYEMKWTLFGILAPCAIILLGTAVSSVLPMALSSLTNKGPHGFTEILYAFTSAAANNGSAFAGLNANTPYFNILLGLSMLIGRFVVILPVLAIAGNLATKKITPTSSGTFATDTFTFGVLLVGVILIVGALTFLPALFLGPIVEHFLILNGQTF